MKRYLFIIAMIIYHAAFSQNFDVESIFNSGSNESRINLVILSDGYQENELTKFIVDAKNFSNNLFSQSPYKEYKNYFNVYAIKVPSNKSGASHPGTASDVSEPAHPISSVDNYFGSSFDAYGIHRLLVANKTVNIFNVLANNFPTYDQSMILVNSPYYGGSGGEFPVASLNVSSNEIAIHELGHSFVNLIDEYYAGDIYAREGINMTQVNDPSNVRWKNWYGDNEIGIYPHCCGGNSDLWYKPHQNCKMQYLGAPFCSVCIEGTIERIHGLISPIEAFSPQNNALLDISVPIDFAVSLIEVIPNTFKSEWYLDGQLIASNHNEISISRDDLASNQGELVFTVEDTTLLTRIDNHNTIHIHSIVWNLNSMTSSIDKVEQNYIKIDLFPNPTQDVLHVNLLGGQMQDFTISIYDISGHQMLLEDIKPGVKTLNEIDFSKFSAGIYIVNFNFKAGNVVSRKIFKTL